VVFLFGIFCFSLGFVVKAVRISYPDCEANLRVNRKRDEWERVSIEFEYRGSDFRNHERDSNSCGVIVSLEYDWSKFPLEVIERKTAIRSLSE
jgi:hypothetical protein